MLSRRLRSTALCDSRRRRRFSNISCRLWFFVHAWLIRNGSWRKRGNKNLLSLLLDFIVFVEHRSTIQVTRWCGWRDHQVAPTAKDGGLTERRTGWIKTGSKPILSVRVTKRNWACPWYVRSQSCRRRTHGSHGKATTTLPLVVVLVTTTRCRVQNATTTSVVSRDRHSSDGRMRSTQRCKPAWRVLISGIKEILLCRWVHEANENKTFYKRRIVWKEEKGLVCNRWPANLRSFNF